MAKCTVTLNVARLGRAYVGKSVVIADVEARDDGTYWTTTEHAPVLLTNSPLAEAKLDRLTAYSFVLPDGSSSVRLVPDAEEAEFSALQILRAWPGAGAVYAIDPDVAISTSGLEPLGLSVGDYWVVDNQFLPSHGDLNQKTS